MLEASYALQSDNDLRTLTIAKKMLDHAMKYGWDEKVGGFYDGGYYFKGEDKCRIVKDTKNWWAQAEALNALLLFSKYFRRRLVITNIFSVNGSMYNPISLTQKVEIGLKAALIKNRIFELVLKVICGNAHIILGEL